MSVHFFSNLLGSCSSYFCVDIEAMEQAKKVKEEQKAAAAAAAAAVTSTVPYTPDYAAGLVSPAPSVSSAVTSTVPYTPDYAAGLVSPAPSVRSIYCQKVFNRSLPRILKFGNVFFIFQHISDWYDMCYEFGLQA